MDLEKIMLVTESEGGLYTLRDTESGESHALRARGAFRHRGVKLLVGDRVRCRKEADGTYAMEEICERQCALIRPPLANLDIIYAVIPAAQPTPDLILTDKLISIAEHAGIQPVVVITKSDCDRAPAERIRGIYAACGFPVFVTSSATGEGTDALSAYIDRENAGRISAIAGVSGAGKSSLLNVLFPSLSLETGELSRKIVRGKNTTRKVQLFELSRLRGTGEQGASEGYIADTPGFSLLDFTRFDFMKLEDLPYTFREYVPYFGKCRYTKCSHTREEGCAILAAIADGTLPRERHESYCAIREDLRNKHDWDK